MDTLCQKNRVAVKSLIFTILCGVVVLMHVKLCFGQSTTIAIRTVVQYESTVVVRTPLHCVLTTNQELPTRRGYPIYYISASLSTVSIDQLQ